MHCPGEDKRGKGIMWGGVGWVGGEKVVAMIIMSSGHICSMPQQTCPINFVHCTLYWAYVIRLFLDRAVSEG